ncbi:unnamed protein product, partial [Mesorhabditis belari]|uniref:C3H1-type domain-containing protein n=1 Tax=Mesorhabditis belari TaxID=2138241 RepID=A0AAF3J431_9BILA
MLDSFTQSLSGSPGLFPFETRDSTPLSGLSSTIAPFSTSTSNQSRVDRPTSPLLGSTSWLFPSQSLFSTLSPQLHSQGLEADVQITTNFENKLHQAGDLSAARLSNLSAFVNLKNSTQASPTISFDPQTFPLSISELTGVPFKQMPPNAGSPANRAGGVATAARRGMTYTVVSPGAPGTPLALPPATNIAAAQQPKNPKLYKTEMCRTWIEQGRCNYGDRCQYAHGEHEKRYVPRHPKYKTEMCQSFHKTGYCPYGHRCHFIHSESEVHQYQREKETALRAALSPLTPGLASLPLAPPSQLIGRSLLQSSQQSSIRVPQAIGAGYGSAGESPSSSSADSGSESPAGSFSPGLDLDEACLSPLAAVFGLSQPGSTQRSLSSSYAAYMSSILPKLGSTTINTQRFVPGHGGFTDTFPGASPTSTSSSSTTTAKPSDEENSQMGAFLEDIVAWSVDDGRPEKPGRLPVFAQLSNPQ